MTGSSSSSRSGPRIPGPRVINLSGGNQQKVVLAKWFNTNGEIFIFDEPTLGIDVGSKQEIYKVMVDLLKQGKAIMMVSSDMPEVISMSDRVIVMKDGEKSRTHHRRSFRREHPDLFDRRQGDMSREGIGGQKQVAPESLFKRYENLTVLSIFVGFVIIIVLWQLIMTVGQRFPTFISPVNLLNILQQVGVPGIVAVGMTIVMISGGIDLSVGMLASLVSIVTALGISKWHFGVAPSILIGILSAVVLESLMGYIISRTKVEPFIITLGGMISFRE